MTFLEKTLFLLNVESLSSALFLLHKVCLMGLLVLVLTSVLGTLQRSTLRQKLNRGDKEGAAEEFLKYTIAGGKVLKGLVNRRNDERAIFLS